MHPTLLLALALTVGDPSENIQTAAFIEADALEVGGEYEILIEINFPEAVTAGKAGVPAPFLQIDVPPSVRLTGKTLTTHRELARNEFIQEPYERLLKEAVNFIPFELIAEPKPDERIGLNLVAYVSAGDGSEPTFFRRRLELPVRGSVDAVATKKKRSDWGTDKSLLQIGQKMKGLSLPGVDGVQVDLGQWIGKKNLIVSTYRAYW
ncbi:MAG: hypothetical protein ACI841_000082 [Planctomycetota bacterium]|jgi:hypothetical protein